MDGPAEVPNAETAKLVKAVLAASDRHRITLKHFEEEFLRCTGESFPWQHLNYASVTECLESMDSICAIEKLTVTTRNGRVVEDLFVTLREEKPAMSAVKSSAGQALTAPTVTPGPQEEVVASAPSANRGGATNASAATTKIGINRGNVPNAASASVPMSKSGVDRGGATNAVPSFAPSAVTGVHRGNVPNAVDTSAPFATSVIDHGRMTNASNFATTGNAVSGHPFPAALTFSINENPHLDSL